MTEIVNKIKQSKLITIDLEKFLTGITVAELDIKPFLFHEMIVKEEQFRNNLQDHNWEQYKGTILSVHCSSDAIIPHWAWMLITQHAIPFADDVVFGTKEIAYKNILEKKMDEADWEIYRDKFVLVKGCNKAKVPADAYLYATKKLMPIAGKIMYGEACSNVPVYRKK